MLEKHHTKAEEWIGQKIKNSELIIENDLTAEITGWMCFLLCALKDITQDVSDLINSNSTASTKKKKNLYSFTFQNVGDISKV